MEIFWYGQSCFRIKTKGATIVTDPYDPQIGLKLPKLSADIVTISHQHSDHNYLKAISGTPRVIDGPGEYEINNVFIEGLISFHDTKQGMERGLNYIFIFFIEGMKVCHLGDLGCIPDESLMDKIDGVDILIIPVGGVYTINGKQASEIISRLEPRIVIPMHYKIPGLKINLEGLEKFCKEEGICSSEKQESLKINKVTLPEEESQIVILKPVHL
jgi:L-ascorbate metabolism protein UlaG (beta-lactamase superfamily)